MSWTKAAENCTARGSRLVQPDSQEKNDFLVAKFQSVFPTSIWMGISRNPINKQLSYTDGSIVNFNDWGKGRKIITALKLRINLPVRVDNHSQHISSPTLLKKKFFIFLFFNVLYVLLSRYE